MKKKKIIFTVINDLTYDQRMIRICKSLVTNNYEVLLVGRNLPQSKPLSTQPFQQKRLNCFFHKGKFFYIEYNLRLFFFLFLNKFDAVCAIDLDTILPAFYISRWKEKKMIYDAHEYFTEVPEVVRRPHVKSIWERVGNRTVPNIQHCYTVGNSLAGILKEKYKTHFEVIRNVPVLSKEEIIKSPKYTSSKPILLYQGALNEGRGLEEMLVAMTMLDEVEFWLAGEGDLSGFLRKKTIQLQIENRVKFLGYLLPVELKELTPRVHIGINFLKNTSLNYYYSLANKTFDYVNAGVPAIHMKFPEYKKLINEFEVGILIDDLEKETIVTAVNTLLQKEDFYKKIKDNCRQAKEEWNWEKEEKKLITFYDDLFFLPQS